MKAIRVMCTGMVHPDLILESLRKGADGIIVMG
jgi:F420-non-reducing hydrogenase iron-sulfur subunit